MFNFTQSAFLLDLSLSNMSMYLSIYKSDLTVVDEENCKEIQVMQGKWLLFMKVLSIRRLLNDCKCDSH